MSVQHIPKRECELQQEFTAAPANKPFILKWQSYIIPAIMTFLVDFSWKLNFNLVTIDK